MASINYAAIREAIGLILDTLVPATLKSVNRYEPATIGSNQLPAATIYHAGSARALGQESLGAFGFQDEWHINIRLCSSAPGAEVTAQQLYDTMIPAIRGAFDPAGLLQPNGAGVVLDSQLTTSTLAQNAVDDSWVASFTLVTLNVV